MKFWIADQVVLKVHLHGPFWLRFLLRVGHKVTSTLSINIFAISSKPLAAAKWIALSPSRVGSFTTLGDRTSSVFKMLQQFMKDTRSNLDNSQLIRCFIRQCR